MTPDGPGHLLILGHGYSGAAVAEDGPPGWRVTSTVRTAEKAARLAAAGRSVVVFDGAAPRPALKAALQDATHILQTAGPGAGGADPFLAWHGADLAAAPKLAWLGYLSTVGVYGDHGGAWVDEATPVTPMNDRSRARVAAEEAWLAAGAARGVPVQLFRLGGIYGPGRNQLGALKDGTQRRIVKPGQVFNRIHRADIAGLVWAGIARPIAGPVLHGVDGHPSPPQDVVVEAARLLGMDPPPEITIEEARLSPMGLSFYAENKRVSNARTLEELGYQLRFPTYREALADLAVARDWERPPPEGA